MRGAVVDPEAGRRPGGGDVSLVAQVHRHRMNRKGPSVTRLLDDLRDGRREVFDDLLAAVYDELQRLAHAQIRHERSATMDTVGLVHEAYVKLAGYGEMEWESRAHFFGVAAQAMRRVLVDTARRRNAQKRGGEAVRLTLHETYHGLPSGPDAWADLESLDEALARLEALNPRHARVVECRYFTGLSIEETAEALGVSPVTVTRDWRMARAWLKDTLARDG